MRTQVTKSVEDAAAKVAKVTDLNPDEVRTAIFDAIRMSNLKVSEFGFLTANGIVPLTLPDGLRLAILPDLHAPAHHEAIMWAIKEFLQPLVRKILCQRAHPGSEPRFAESRMVP